MKVKKQRQKFKFKFVLFIIFSACFLPPNYLGLRLGNAHGAAKDLERNKIVEYTYPKAYSSISQPKEINVNKNIYSFVPRGVIVIMALIFAIAPLCSILWLRFLNDQPLEKHCLFNHVFRDLVRTNTLFVCSLNILAFSFSIFEGSEESSTLASITKYLVLIIEAVFLVIMACVCLIASVRLYTIRFNVLDPVDEFLGEYSGKSHLFTRLIILVVPIFTTAVLFSNSIQPILYYQLIETDASRKDIPQASRILSWIDMTLCSVSVTLFASVRIYQWKVESKKRTYILEPQILELIRNAHNDDIQNSSNETNEESSPNPQESGENNLTNLIDVRRMVPLNLMYLLTALLIMALILLQSYKVVSFDIWWSLTALAGLQGVVFPITIILWHDNLRMYCLRQFKYHINVVIQLTYGALCCNQMFNNEIRPIG